MCRNIHALFGVEAPATDEAATLAPWPGSNSTAEP